MSDYNVNIRIRNGRIVGHMRARGLPDAAALSRATGIGQTQLGLLINMQSTAIRKNGTWRTISLKLAAFFNCLPEDLFTAEQKELALKSNVREFDVSQEDLQDFLIGAAQRVLPPDEKMMKDELVDTLHERVNTLPHRTATVLRLRFGLGDHEEHTLAEIAQLWGVTRERIRQIENRGLKLLARPKNRQILLEAGKIDT